MKKQPRVSDEVITLWLNSEIDDPEYCIPIEAAPKVITAAYQDLQDARARNKELEDAITILIDSLEAFKRILFRSRATD